MKAFRWQPRTSLFLTLLLGPLALCVWALASPAPTRADDPPAAEKQITLLYTVNNAGYTDVCG